MFIEVTVPVHVVNAVELNALLPKALYELPFLPLSALVAFVAFVALVAFVAFVAQEGV